MIAPRRILFAAAAVALLALVWFGWTWFRDSPLVKVRHVEISGLSNSPDARAIRRRLRETALRMTTLDVRRKELAEAVSAYPIVRSVSASGNFPSTLEVKVNEYVPVALLAGPDGKSVPVAFDGTLLPRVDKTKLAEVAVTATPERDGFETRRVRVLVAVLAAAPAPLRSELERAYLDKERGIVVAMRDGPELELGTSSRLAAKWASATRVLAASSSIGADAIDVRLPERPAASGFGDPANAQL